MLVCFELDHRDVAQLGRALRSGRKGRRFESCHPDQYERLNFNDLAVFYMLIP